MKQKFQNFWEENWKIIIFFLGMIHSGDRYFGEWFFEGIDFRENVKQSDFWFQKVSAVMTGIEPWPAGMGSNPACRFTNSIAFFLRPFCWKPFHVNGRHLPKMSQGHRHNVNTLFVVDSWVNTQQYLSKNEKKKS